MRSAGRNDPLDCSRPATALFWFVAGVVIATGTMAATGRGDWTALLRVGSANPLLPRIEAELGPVALLDALGHDGQLYYLIARDPFGTRDSAEAIAKLDDNGPSYRYRRILFPLLAGGFGQLGGRATLYAMMTLLALATGLATVALADLAFQLNLKGGAVIVAAVNPGLLVSLMLLTADAMALGLALAGIALAMRTRTGGAVTTFALAALAKEMYLLVPLGVAAWALQRGHWRTAVAFAVAPALPILAWTTWVSWSLPVSGDVVRNFGIPLGGILSAVPIWLHSPPDLSELCLATFAVVIIALAGVALALGRNRLLRWVAAPWFALACCSTVRHWEQPNNAARAFAILWPMSLLLLNQLLSQRTGVSGATLPRDVETAEEVQ